jgi:uncharacterized membrane protein
MNRDESRSGPIERIPSQPRVSVGEQKLTETHQLILQYFRERGKKTHVTFDEVSEAVGLPHEEVHRHVDDLHAEGLVEKDGEHQWLA